MLCDFGSAGIRALGGVAATRAYMAPEQVDGGTTTAATDLYAAGLVMVECLQGSLPDRGVVQLARLPASPRRQALEKVLSSLLHASPGGRPPNGRAAATALLHAGALPATAAGGNQLLAHVEMLARRHDGFRGPSTVVALRNHPVLAAMRQSE
jgi:serine/threonine protein kinase